MVKNKFKYNFFILFHLKKQKKQTLTRLNNKYSHYFASEEAGILIAFSLNGGK